MKNKITILGTLIFASFIFSSCGNTAEHKQTPSTKLKGDKQLLIHPDFSGNYHGIQPSYFLKNQYGDELVINGQKVSVPSIDFKFLVKEDGAVSLQQTNIEDNSRIYYDGTIKIIKDDTAILKIACSLSDGKYSNPTYTLAINKSQKTAICICNNEPEFNLQKK